MCDWKIRNYKQVDSKIYEQELQNYTQVNCKIHEWKNMKYSKHVHSRGCYWKIKFVRWWNVKIIDWKI